MQAEHHITRLFAAFERIEAHGVASRPIPPDFGAKLCHGTLASSCITIAYPPGDMAEVALAHRVANAVEASYRRGDMVEKRRGMMSAWADHLTCMRRAEVKIVRTDAR